MKLLRSASALAFLASALAAHAATLSGGSISLSGATDYSTTIGSLAKFDASKGVLTGVALTVGYGFNSTITVSATSDSMGNVRTESAARFDSSDAGVRQVLNAVVNTTSATIGSAALSPAAYDLLGNRSIYSVGPTSGSTSANYNSSMSASNTYSVPASGLAAFVATPTSTRFDVLGQTLTGLILSATGGNASALQQTSANQSIGVQYTYTPAQVVPEPSAFAALGFGALALLRRRKRA